MTQTPGLRDGSIKLEGVFNPDLIRPATIKGVHPEVDGDRLIKMIGGEGENDALFQVFDLEGNPLIVGGEAVLVSIPLGDDQ